MCRRGGSRRHAPIASVAALALVLCAFPSLAAGAPGDLDPTFSQNGQVRIELDKYTFPDNVVAENDGGAVISAGVGSEISCSHIECQYPDWRRVLMRFAADGSLDKTFGDDGIVSMPSTDEYDQGSSNELLKLPGGGYMLLTDRLLRFNASGEQDESYPAFPELPNAAFDIDASAGGIVLTGVKYGSLPEPDRAWAARLTTDGSLDTSFSDDGKVLIDVPHERFVVTQVMPMTDDGYLLGGYVYSGDGSVGSVLLIKLDDAGEPVPSFGNGGVLTLSGRFVDLAPRPNGGFLLSRVLGDDPNRVPEVAAFESDGLPDPTFTTINAAGDILPLSTGGFVVGNGDELRAYQSDGEIESAFGGGDGIERTPSLPSAARDVAPNDRIFQTGPSSSVGLLLAHGAEPGPPNADADSLLDADDSCPDVYASWVDGCPLVETGIQLNRYTNRRLSVLTYTLSYPRGCLSGVVKVKRLRRGGQAELVINRHIVDGSVTLRRKLPPGRYFATIGRRQDYPEPGRCRGARSDIVRVLGPQRSRGDSRRS